MDRSPQALALESLIEWWSDAGVPTDDWVRPAPVKPVAKPAKTANKPPAPRVLRVDPIQEARRIAAESADLASLKAAIAGFEGCDLKHGARKTVVSDGVETARVMIVGEAPGADEDRLGLPFVGRSGQLLDRMFAAIGLSRQDSLYITNLLYWRPPGNRGPSPEEVAICRPFLLRQIELLKPAVIIAVGKFAAQTLLNTDDGIMRLRGRRTAYSQEGLAAAIPCIPILHPAYLLRRPQDKSRAWRDLLIIEGLLKELGLA